MQNNYELRSDRDQGNHGKSQSSDLLRIRTYAFGAETVLLPVCRVSTPRYGRSSACFSTATICSTEERFLFTANPLPWVLDLRKCGSVLGITDKSAALA